MTSVTYLTTAVMLLLAMTSVYGNSEELKVALAKVAGVYKDPLKVAKLGLRRTVLVTGCNYGFVNHLMNFKCFMDRLDMKFLVISMDEQVHAFLGNHTDVVSYSMASGMHGEVTSQATEFRSKQFNLITARKKEAVHTILQLGYDVVFSDTDVAALRDFMPYLLWRNVDYVHSLNDWCRIGDKFDMFRSKIEGNTGFYYVRSTNETIKLWADAYAAAPKYPRLDDQAIFWKVLRASKDPPVLPLPECRHFDKPEDLAASVQKSTGQRYLTSCYLDTCTFSSGMLSRQYVPELTYEILLENLGKLGETMCTVHANYISGNKKKMRRMEQYGLWLAEGPKGDSVEGKWRCREYVFIPANATNPSLTRS